MSGSNQQASMLNDMHLHRSLFVYDGDCAFCSRWVNQLANTLDRFPRAQSWQSLDLHEVGLTEDDVNSAAWLLLEGRAYRGYAAFAALLRMQHSFGWRVLGILLEIPPFSLAARVATTGASPVTATRCGSDSTSPPRAGSCCRAARWCRCLACARSACCWGRTTGGRPFMGCSRRIRAATRSATTSPGRCRSRRGTRCTSSSTSPATRTVTRRAGRPTASSRTTSWPTRRS